MLFFWIFYIYIYCRKVNAEFNAQNIRSQCSFFSKCVHLCQQCWLYLDIFILSLIKTLVWINRLSLHKIITQHVPNLLTISTVLLSCSWFRTNNIDQRCTSNTFWKKTCLIKVDFFLLKKGIHVVYLKKQKEVYVTVLLFILYAIWVHVERSKYKMVCIKSPKSSEFALVLINSGHKSLTYNVDFIIF